VVALLLAFAGIVSGSGSIPVALLLLCVLQIVGYVVTRNGEAAILARSWLLALIGTAGLLPLLSLQANLLSEPYVSLSRGSATPAVISTLIVVLFVVVVAVWCAVSFSSTAEVASVAFLPMALLVPGILGLGPEIDQRAALVGLAESSLFAAGAAVLAWSLPRQTRLIVPPVALAIQLVTLALAGRGPSFPPTSGDIVKVLYWTTIVVTGALLTLLPMVSAWLHRSIAAVEEAERPRRSESGGGEPAR
jgi:hypothetical protein